MGCSICVSSSTMWLPGLRRPRVSCSDRHTMPASRRIGAKCCEADCARTRSISGGRGLPPRLPEHRRRGSSLRRRTGIRRSSTAPRRRRHGADPARLRPPQQLDPTDASRDHLVPLARLKYATLGCTCQGAWNAVSQRPSTVMATSSFRSQRTQRFRPTRGRQASRCPQPAPSLQIQSVQQDC